MKIRRLFPFLLLFLSFLMFLGCRNPALEETTSTTSPSSTSSLSSTSSSSSASTSTTETTFQNRYEAFYADYQSFSVLVEQEPSLSADGETLIEFRLTGTGELVTSLSIPQSIGIDSGRELIVVETDGTVCFYQADPESSLMYLYDPLTGLKFDLNIGFGDAVDLYGISLSEGEELPFPEGSLVYEEDGFFCHDAMLGEMETPVGTGLAEMLLSLGYTSEEIGDAEITERIGFFPDERRMDYRLELSSLASAQMPGVVLNLSATISFSYGDEIDDHDFDPAPYLLGAPTSESLVFTSHEDTDQLEGYALSETGGYFQVDFEAGIYDLSWGEETVPAEVEIILSETSGIWIEDGRFRISQPGNYYVKITPESSGFVSLGFTPVQYEDLGSVDNPTLLETSLTGKNEGIGDVECYTLSFDHPVFVEIRVECPETEKYLLSGVNSSVGAFCRITSENSNYFYGYPENQYWIFVSGSYVGEYEISVIYHDVNGASQNLDDMWLITQNQDLLFFAGSDFLGPKGKFTVTTSGSYVMEMNSLVWGATIGASLYSADGSLISSNWNSAVHLDPGTYFVSFTNSTALAIFRPTLKKTS